MQYKYFLQIKAICVCVYVCVLACSCMWVCVCVFLHASKKPFAIKTVGRKERKLRGGIIIYLICFWEQDPLYLLRGVKRKRENEKEGERKERRKERREEERKNIVNGEATSWQTPAGDKTPTGAVGGDLSSGKDQSLIGIHGDRMGIGGAGTSSLAIAVWAFLEQPAEDPLRRAPRVWLEGTSCFRWWLWRSTLRQHVTTSQGCLSLADPSPLPGTVLSSCPQI